MAKANILLADNDPDFLDTRKEYLELSGYRVILANNTMETRTELSREKVDVAILDIRLVDDDDEKDISGLAIAKAPAYKNIPKIILTGHPSTEFVRESLRMDEEGYSPALEFITKEEGAEAMLAAVGQIILVKRSHWWQVPSLPLALLFGAVIAGITAAIYSDPRWLIGTVTFGILYAVLVAYN